MSPSKDEKLNQLSVIVAYKLLHNRYALVDTSGRALNWVNGTYISIPEYSLKHDSDSPIGLVLKTHLTSLPDSVLNDESLGLEVCINANTGELVLDVVRLEIN